MQNIQKLYQDLHEGKISRNQFLFQIRKDSRINSFFTNANSYDETVRILKNRGLLFEIKINESIEEEIGSNDPETSHEGLDNLNEAKNIPKVEKLVNIINDMIAKAVDENGDPVGVIEPNTTWEEPYTYSPIEYKNGNLRITSRSLYKSKPEVETISSKYMMEEGVPILKLIARMYKKALKKASGNQLPTAPSQEETDANQVYENDLNEAGISQKAIDYIKNYIDKFDERTTAIKLIDILLRNTAGVESSDLPDTSTFANGVDEVQSLLEDQDYEGALQVAKETAKEMLSEEGYDDLMESEENDSPGLRRMKHFIKEFGGKKMAEILINRQLQDMSGNMTIWYQYDENPLFAEGVDRVGELLEKQMFLKAQQLAEGYGVKLYHEKSGAKFKLKENKQPTKGADQVNPYELEKGTYYELDCQKESAKDTDKAKAKALKNLNKNPKYYSDLFSKDYNDKANTSDQMQIVKESLKSLIADILSEK